ncbi:hypothetical protein LSTR_LSTR003038 [Laodelphax striatellus]|uniref:Ion transport domain-containing protein n=1 Tax=Laodelphax striatellus TaxID=195883 RepID=A0A482XSI6_LAOST|nr:hypothetical protein LSTR_LSTR003038 [Laodelphax striatellus]
MYSLNQLLWYFAELERQKCYSLPGGLPDWDNKSDSCMKWRSFGNVFEATQSLFWASFGMVGIDTFDLTGIKTYTRFWGLLMFGSYSVINVIVLLNLLIAMMSNSFAMIEQHSDTEWKFARTKLWMSYFEESATLPPPFNIFPTPKLIFKLLGIREKDKQRRMSLKRKKLAEKERDHRYSAVMRALVWRYVSRMHRHADDSPVTEDDVNEVKGEITAMRHEILDVLQRNGMDIGAADASSRDNLFLGKKNRIWERRLMKDFHLAPVAPDEDLDALLRKPPPDNEDPLDKFRRIARLAVLGSSAQKWSNVIDGVCQVSQIGRCNNRESFKNQQNLQRAMQEAKRLVTRTPLIESRSPSPRPLPGTTVGSSLNELIRDMSKETLGHSGYSSRIGTGKPGKKEDGKASDILLSVKDQLASMNQQTGHSPPHTQSRSAGKPEGKQANSGRKSPSAPPPETNEDPSPLLHQKRCGAGESPPKVFKKKAPMSAPQPNQQQLTDKDQQQKQGARSREPGQGQTGQGQN